MKKRKGFTLIELLAVIVILAIIAVIATPIIVGIIEDSRKAAFERSVEGIIHATDIDFGTQETLANNTYTITDGQVDKTLKTPIKNIEGFSGTIKYDDKGNSSYAINNGTYCMLKSKSGEITTTDYNGTCELIEYTDESCFVVEDLESGGVTITDYVCDDKDVVIPESINGKTVKEIYGDTVEVIPNEIYMRVGAFYNKGLTSVKLPKTIEFIGVGAFSQNNISGVLDLSDLNNLKVIDSEAFYINNLVEVKLPPSIINIYSYAFGDNPLTSVKFCGLENLDGVTINIGYTFGWAEGYDESNISFGC